MSPAARRSRRRESRWACDFKLAVRELRMGEKEDSVLVSEISVCELR